MKPHMINIPEDTFITILNLLIASDGEQLRTKTQADFRTFRDAIVNQYRVERERWTAWDEAALKELFRKPAAGANFVADLYAEASRRYFLLPVKENHELR